VETLRRRKERQDETQFPTKIDGFLSFIPCWMNANVLFCRVLKNLTLCMTKLRVLVLCFSYFMDNSHLPLQFLKTFWIQRNFHFSFEKKKNPESKKPSVSVFLKNQ
jgi:hypothetical protein